MVKPARAGGGGSVHATEVDTTARRPTNGNLHCLVFPWRRLNCSESQKTATRLSLNTASVP